MKKDICVENFVNFPPPPRKRTVLRYIVRDIADCICLCGLQRRDDVRVHGLYPRCFYRKEPVCDRGEDFFSAGTWEVSFGLVLIGIGALSTCFNDSDVGVYAQVIHTM